MNLVKISELPDADSPVFPGNVTPVVQDGITKKASIAQLGYLPAGLDAVTRTIQDKLRDTVSVKDFGAVGDGVTDDSAAIQAAINYTETTGGTLYFPAGVYIVGTQLNVSEEGMLFLGAGRDVLDSLTGTVLKTSTAINLFSFTAPSRRTVVQNMVLDGNNVGLNGADVATPKVEFHNCTITKFVNAGLNIRSFSTLIRECDIVFNNGHGVVYDGNANDSRIVNSSISGNAKHGVFVDTALDYPDGIYLNGLNMENNCTAGNSITRYAHVFLGGGTVGAYISNMYHESDITQPGFADQLYYNVGDGSESVFITNVKSNCSSSAKFNFHVRVGASASNVSLKNWWAGNFNTGIINNETGVSGSLFTENVVETGVSGFQTKLVDYAGSPSTAGRSLTNSPARLVAKVARTTDQSITSATPATIEFNSATFDPATMFSSANYGIDVREEGYYQVNVRVTMKNYTAGEIANLRIRVAGAVTDLSQVQLETTSGTATAEINTIVKCEAGNRIDVQAYKTTNNFDIAGGATGTNFSVVKVAQDAN